MVGSIVTTYPIQTLLLGHVVTEGDMLRRLVLSNDELHPNKSFVYIIYVCILWMFIMCIYKYKHMHVYI